MAWANEDLRRQFAEIAKLLQLTGEDRFRVRAYERAADAIGAATVDLATVQPDALTDIQGIGSSTAAKITEYLETGSIQMLENLRVKVPVGVLELTRVPGLGPKTAIQLYEQLGVASVEDLRRAIAEQRLRTLPGMGAKTEENLSEALARIGGKDADRIPAADALAVAEELCDRLGAAAGASAAAYAGSLRRMRETVGDIDILVATSDPGPVTAALLDSGLVREVIGSGDKKTSVLTVRDVQADLRVVAPEAWGAALVYFTGSKAHNIRIRERAVRRGLTLNEYGLFRRTEEGEAGERVASATEEDVYAALGMDWVPPPLREDTGEVEAAAEHRLPAVVTEADLRGDLHGHSDWSGDGKATLEQMVTAAAERGLSYWAVTDHAEKLAINGLTREQFQTRRKAITELQDRVGIRILDGAELNIDLHGNVDFDEDFLATFDFCVASVHTHMQRGEAEQTERILEAMRNPCVNAIGHPTGRKLGRRPAYPLNLDAVIDAAIETGTALEVNGSLRRLDLSGELVRRAVEAGATLTISTDAHTVAEFRNLRFGVATAQRGWATVDHVLNCRDLEGLQAFVAAKRR